MRLTCPNCGAQYEVPDHVIPDQGRDVQCSNCGDTWFQSGAPLDLGQAFADTTWDTPDGDLPPEPEPVAAPRRPLDPEIRDLLREEAARETRARARESAPLESQPDLGLPEPGVASTTDATDTRREREARQRLARLQGSDEQAAMPDISDDGAAQADEAPASRRDLLPDVEEINSSLRSRSRQDEGEDDEGDTLPHAPRRRGFRVGLSLPLIAAALALFVYGNAGRIILAIPQAEPGITAYVAQVDAGRSWLDAQADGLLVWLDRTAARLGG